MIDTSAIDLIRLVGTPLKRVASTGGGEYHGACPFCGGSDRFIVQQGKGRWSCRKCQPRWQDAIAFVRQRDGCGFRAALDTLGLKASASQRESTRRRAPVSQPQASAPVSAPPFDARFYHDNYSAFLRGEGVKPCDAFYDWLSTERGISAIVAGGVGLSLAVEGLHIPFWQGGRVIGGQTRRWKGKPRYLTWRGSTMPLYELLSCPVREGVDAIIVESALDALTVRSAILESNLETADSIAPVAILSAGGTNALAKVAAHCERIFIALDADTAGDKAADKLKLSLPLARRLRPVGGKDVGEMWKGGGYAAILSWLRSRWERQSE